MYKKIILGTAQFGLNYGINNAKGKLSKNEIFDILDYAYQKNITLLDTADDYGDATTIIGEYQKVKKTQFTINTKFKAQDNIDLEKHIDHTLKRLNNEYVNIYFYHHYDHFVNYPSLSKQLIRLKEKNKIKKIGVSVYENYELEHIIESNTIDVIQFPYNLFDNHYQRGQLIKKAKEKNKEIQVRSVFLQGLFFMHHLPDYLLPLLPYFEELKQIENESKIPLPELAYYLLTNKVTSITI